MLIVIYSYFILFAQKPIFFRLFDISGISTLVQYATRYGRRRSSKSIMERFTLDQMNNQLQGQ